MSDLTKDEGSCGQRIANMICVLPKGHSGLHDDLDDAASNRMRLIDAEQELVAKNNRIAALERENAVLEENAIRFREERDRLRQSQSHEPRERPPALMAVVDKWQDAANAWRSGSLPSYSRHCDAVDALLKDIRGASHETCDHDPMSHGSTLECDERGALKCTLCNAFDSSSQNTGESRE